MIFFLETGDVFFWQISSRPTYNPPSSHVTASKVVIVRVPSPQKWLKHSGLGIIVLCPDVFFHGYDPKNA